MVSIMNNTTEMMKETHGTLDEILSRLLFEKKMRAMDLARELNIPQPTIHRIATGKSTTPHIGTLEPNACQKIPINCAISRGTIFLRARNQSMRINKNFAIIREAD